MITLSRLIFWPQVKGQRRGKNNLDKFLQSMHGYRSNLMFVVNSRKPLETRLGKILINLKPDSA